MAGTLPLVPPRLAVRLRAEQSPQRPFDWCLERWLPVVSGVGGADEVLRQLPTALAREDVRAVVQEQLTLDRGIAAFVPVMIWGGPGGYGAFRTRARLTANRTREAWKSAIDPAVEPKLLAGARVAREEGPVEACRLMNNSGHVKYLGGAFFTKWISFSSARSSVDAEEVAPILGKRVRDWIDVSTRTTTRVNLSTTSTDDYARYLALLDAWRKSGEWSMTRTQVERAIFEFSRGDSLEPPAQRVDMPIST